MADAVPLSDSAPTAPMLAAVPVLTTDRLVLRRFTAADLDAHHAILSDPETMKHFGPNLMGREECWRRSCAAVGMWSVMGFGGWLATMRDDGRVIGNIGLFNAWRDMRPVFGTDPEMGWIFDHKVHGRGYASEAGRAVLAWADAHLKPMPVWAIIDPGNAPSLRLAERLGFIRQDDSEYQGAPTTVFQRPARN